MAGASRTTICPASPRGDGSRSACVSTRRRLGWEYYPSGIGAPPSPAGAAACCARNAGLPASPVAEPAVCAHELDARAVMSHASRGQEPTTVTAGAGGEEEQGCGSARATVWRGEDGQVPFGIESEDLVTDPEHVVPEAAGVLGVGDHYCTSYLMTPSAPPPPMK